MGVLCVMCNMIFFPVRALKSFGKQLNPLDSSLELYIFLICVELT